MSTSQFLIAQWRQNREESDHVINTGMKFDQYNDSPTVGNVIGRNRRYKSVATQTVHDAGGTDHTHCSKIPPPSAIKLSLHKVQVKKNHALDRVTTVARV